MVSELCSFSPNGWSWKSPLVLQLLQQKMQCSEVSVTKLIALELVWRWTTGQDFLHDRLRGVFFFFVSFQFGDVRLKHSHLHRLFALLPER